MNFTALIYASLIGILPSFLWLWFWLREDDLHPEPKILIAITFVCGCVAVIVAIFLEKYVADFLVTQTSRYLVWAAIEEGVKYFVILVVVMHSQYLDEPIDIMIYFVTVALGFAALENMFFTLSNLGTGQIAKGIITGNLRFIGSTLVHTVSSASIGFSLGLVYYKKRIAKIIAGILGFALAIALHASFNLAIISSTSVGTLKVFGWVWLGVVVLIILFEEIKVVKPKTV